MCARVLCACQFAIGLLVACATQPPLPARALELNSRGVAALEQGDLELASANFELALEYNPSFVEALANQGILELQRGNATRAEQLLRRARRINSHIAQPHHGLGVLAERLGQHDEASQHYRAALAVDPGFVPARLNLARLLFNADLLYDAKIEFEKLIQAAPDRVEGYAGLAEVLVRLHRRNEAESIIDEQLTRFPDSVELQILAARTELRQGNVAEARRRLSKLTRADGTTAALAFSWLGVTELVRGKPRSAIGAAKKALELDKHSPVARHVMATALANLGDERAKQWSKPAARH